MAIHGVVLAAGMGTRMRSSLPKVMHPVLGRPMVGSIVEALREAEASSVVVVVGYAREQVQGYLESEHQREAMPLRFAVQAEQLGTAHAASQALPHLEDATGWVVIVNGDLPNLEGAWLARLVHEVSDAGAQMGFLTMRLLDPSGYGRVVRGASGQAERIVEHRDCSVSELAIDEVNAGVYAVRVEFLREKLGTVSTDNAQGEFYLTDLVELASRPEGGGAHAVVVSDARIVMGVNDRSQLSDAQTFAQQRVNARWMREGVTMLLAETTLVEYGAELAADVHLGPGVHVTGQSRVGEGARIGAGCVLQDAVVGAGARLGAHVVVEGGEIGDGEVVEPLTRVTSS